MNIKQFEAAKEQSKFSYSPYSNYKVSASILLKNGDIVSGMNIENSSYSLTICAERCALSRCYAMGYTKNDIVSLLIYTNSKTSMPYPCGACRQVMTELMPSDSECIVVNDNKEPITMKVSELIPNLFTKEELKK